MKMKLVLTLGTLLALTTAASAQQYRQHGSVFGPQGYVGHLSPGGAITGPDGYVGQAIPGGGGVVIGPRGYEGHVGIPNGAFPNYNLNQ